MCANSRLYVVLLLVFIAGVTGGNAGIINVPADQPSIQAGINVAIFGDEVVVAPGTYHAHINFKGKGITVRSTDPNDPAVVAATVLDGDANGSVVQFKSGEGPSSVLSGLTITNGTGTVRWWATMGGGVYCTGSSPKILRCVIIGNTAPFGGGIYTTYGAPLIKDNTIVGNTATYGGGLCLSWCTATAIGNVIAGNTATQGGGGIIHWEKSVTVAGNLIANNSAPYGGGINTDSRTELGTILITRNTLSRNTAGVIGGGIWYRGLGTVTISNSIVVGSNSGGGIVNDEGATVPAVQYCDVNGNSPRNYMGMAGQTGINGNISVNPRFVNVNGSPTNPTNFRLRSSGGYWNGRRWVATSEDSPCIDAGNPAAPFGNEPSPNGGRINMGFDGNTPYASKTPPPGATAPALVTATAVSTAAGAQITLNLSAAAVVQVRILNMAGREVAVLPEQSLQAGTQTLLWNGRSASGTVAPAGQYLIGIAAKQASGIHSEVLVPLRK